MSYKHLISKFLYQQVPTKSVKSSVRFDAITDAIIGTKQLRYGPKPSPEVQVGVRDILRLSEDCINFFVPWASRKQETGADVDVLEFVALRQLAGVRDTLLSYGVQSKFHFRLEDATDAILFNEVAELEEDTSQINKYAQCFTSLAKQVLPGCSVRKETDMMDMNVFRDKVHSIAPELRITWAGGPVPGYLKVPFSQDQINYFLDLYAKIYPQDSFLLRTHQLSTYFGCAIARRELGATATPTDPFVFVTFSHPVPDDPVRNNRLYYRTLPERYTNTHKPAWMSRGYFMINETDETITPRYRGDIDESKIIKGDIFWEGIQLCADYAVAD